MKRDASHDLGLDPRVFSNHEEARACNGSGTCCYNQSILITDEDVKRIVNAIPSIKLEELLVFFVRHDGYKDAELLKEHPEIYIEGEPCYMALRFVPLHGEPDTRACPFLNRDSGKCTIHDCKPMVCRAYPFIVQDGIITRLEKIRCKVPYHPADQQSILDLQRTLLGSYKELDAFKEKVATWNATRRDSTFPEFFTTFFTFK